MLFVKLTQLVLLLAAVVSMTGGVALAVPPNNGSKTETSSATKTPSKAETTLPTKNETLDSPEAQAIAAQLQELLKRKPEELVKLGEDECDKLTAMLRYGRDVVRLEQGLSNLAQLHAMYVTERNAAEAELAKHRSELQSRLTKINDKLASRPQDRDLAIRTLVGAYAGRIQHAQAQVQRWSSQSKQIDDRHTQLTSLLQSRQLERELAAEVPEATTNNPANIRLPDVADLPTIPSSSPSDASKTVATGDVQKLLLELGVSTEPAVADSNGVTQVSNKVIEPAPARKK